MLGFLIAKIAKNLLAKIWKPFKRSKLFTHFRPSPLPIHQEQTKFSNFKEVDLFAVDKQTKYVDYYDCYQQSTIK